MAEITASIAAGDSVLIGGADQAGRSRLIDAVLSDRRFGNRIIDRIDTGSTEWSRSDLSWSGPSSDQVMSLSRVHQRWTELSADRHPVILVVEGCGSLNPLTAHAVRHAVAAQIVVLIATESETDPVTGDIAALIADHSMIRRTVEDDDDAVSVSVLVQRIAALSIGAQRLAAALATVGTLDRRLLNRVRFGREVTELELVRVAGISQSGEVALTSSALRDHLRQHASTVDCHRSLLDLIDRYDAHHLVDSTRLVTWTQAANRPLTQSRAVQAARELLRDFKSGTALKLLAHQHRSHEVDLLIGRAHLLLGQHELGAELVQTVAECDSAAGVEARLLWASYGLLRFEDIGLADRTLSRTAGLHDNDPSVTFERLALTTHRAVIGGASDDIADRLAEHFADRQIRDRTELALAAEGVEVLAAKGLRAEAYLLGVAIDRASTGLGVTPLDIPATEARRCLAKVWAGDLSGANNRAGRTIEEAIAGQPSAAIAPLGSVVAQLLRLGGRIGESILMSALTWDMLPDQPAPHRLAVARHNCIAAAALIGDRSELEESWSTSNRAENVSDIVAASDARTQWQIDRLVDRSQTMAGLRLPLEALFANGKPLWAVTIAAELLLAPAEAWLVDLLADITNTIDQPCLAHPIAAYAAATRSGDVDELERTGVIFESSGFMPLAWHAWAQAAELCLTSDPARAFRAVVGTERCQLACRGLAEPWVPTRSTLLSNQERRVAAWADGDETTRELAARHHRSVRTIDNHLHRIYQKLGIGGRAELRSLMTQPPTPEQPMSRLPLR